MTIIKTTTKIYIVICVTERDNYIDMKLVGAFEERGEASELIQSIYRAKCKQRVCSTEWNEKGEISFEHGNKTMSYKIKEVFKYELQNR